MKILVDTQALILAGRDELPKPAALIFASASNEICFSLVSLWEIAIKSSLGKLRFKRRISEYYQLLVEEQGLIPVSIEALHIEKVAALPFHHKDPFDRLLVGQALVERLTILSGDASFDRYGCKRVWA